MLKYLYQMEIVNPDGSVADSWVDENIIPQVGVTYFANAMFGDASPIGTFYFGLFQNNYVPTANTTAADLPSVAGEFLGYDETTRRTWNRVFDGVGAISNDASRAELTCNVDRRVYGAFLVSSSTKGGSSGTLISIARFQTPKDIVAGQLVRGRVILNLIPAEVI